LQNQNALCSEITVTLLPRTLINVTVDIRNAIEWIEIEHRFGVLNY